MLWKSPSPASREGSKKHKTRPNGSLFIADPEYEACLSGNVTRPTRRPGRENVRNSSDSILRFDKD